jgi:beta-galactosidase
MKDRSSQVDRRVFLLGTAAAGALAGQSESSRLLSAELDRRVYELNRGWLFGGRVRPGVSALDGDDSNWEKITLPHANVRLPWHSFDEKDFQFVSAYRRHFQALPGWKGKRVFVDFSGAMAAATV